MYESLNLPYNYLQCLLQRVSLFDQSLPYMVVTEVT